MLLFDTGKKPFFRGAILRADRPDGNEFREIIYEKGEKNKKTGRLEAV